MRYVILFVLLALPAAQGCSVAMAMSGDPDPDLSIVRVGASRGEVEMQIGAAVQQSTTREGYTIAKYHYTIGNKPDAGRAIAHGALDVLTLGLWEVIGTPVEAIIVKHYDMTVTYDRDMRVLAVNAPVEMIKEEEPQGVVASD